jgi:hypothetical protein
MRYTAERASTKKRYPTFIPMPEAALACPFASRGCAGKTLFPARASCPLAELAYCTVRLIVAAVPLPALELPVTVIV